MRTTFYVLAVAYYFQANVNAIRLGEDEDCYERQTGYGPPVGSPVVDDPMPMKNFEASASSIPTY